MKLPPVEFHLQPAWQEELVLSLVPHGLETLGRRPRQLCRARFFVAHSGVMPRRVRSALSMRANIGRPVIRCVCRWLSALVAGAVLASNPVDAWAASSEHLTVTRSGHLVVLGTANGHPIRFIVDTGCPVTIIDSSVYPRLGTSGQAGAPVGHTFYPQSYAYRATSSGSVADLRIGGTALERVPVGVTALDTVLGRGVSGRGVPDAEGILGSDLLLRCGAVVDLKHGDLLLNPGPAERAALAQRFASEGYVAVGMTPTNGFHLAVPCAVGAVPFRLVVDTGSPGTVLQRSILNSGDLVRPTRVSYMRTLGGVSTVAWIPLQDWNIGDLVVERATVATGDFRGGIYGERTANGSQVEGVLGLEPLAYLRAVIDFSTRKIYLKRPASRVTPGNNPELTQQRAQGTVIPNISVPTPQGGKGKSR